MAMTDAELVRLAQSIVHHVEKTSDLWNKGAPMFAKLMEEIRRRERKYGHGEIDSVDVKNVEAALNRVSVALFNAPTPIVTIEAVAENIASGFARGRKAKGSGGGARARAGTKR